MRQKHTATRQTMEISVANVEARCLIDFLLQDLVLNLLFQKLENI